MQPHLGVVSVGLNRSFVVADIPGLIEGAAEGSGLGHQFLKHLQRTKLLLHLVDIAPAEGGSTAAVAGAKAIVEELRKYDESLFAKPRWLVLNKIDLIAEDSRDTAVSDFMEQYHRQLGVPERSFTVSALAGTGCTELTRAIMDYLSAIDEAGTKSAEATSGARAP